MMLRVTFYSYKGGVGRTLALLNVAAALAASGRKVVAVDLDLEAPGFGLTSLIGRDNGAPRPGVSDFIFASLLPGEVTAEPYVVPAPLPDLDGRLLLMPAGTRAMELAGSIGEFYRDPASDAAKVFSLLVAEIHERFAPDYLFFDSRTGFADVAGVCTIELPQVLVAFSGLGEQSVHGTARVLTDLRAHPARVGTVATLLVLSPVPRAQDVGVPILSDMDLGAFRSGLGIRRGENMLVDAIYRAQSELLPIVLEDFDEVQKRFPRLDRRDLMHGLEYDPEVPIRDELAVLRACPLAAQYRSLARSISRAHPKDAVFVAGDEPLLPSLPILVNHAGG